MWFLQRLMGGTTAHVKTLARLKANDSYAVNPRVSQDKAISVQFRVLGFSASDVVGSRSKPDVILERNGVNAVVDGQIVTEDRHYLHDQQIIHLGKGNAPFRLTWDPVSIYHNKELNPDMHKKLIEQGQRAGFYVIDGISSSYDKPTHHCISISPELYELTTRTCLDLASNKVHFVRPDWVEELCKVDDKKLDFKAFNDKIQPIMVDKYEGLDQTAVLGPDERRKRLFKRMDFWFFNQQQFNEHAELVKLVGGTAHLKTFEQVLASDIEGNPLFIAPPNADMLPDWTHVQDKYCKEMDVIRVLLDKEIVYAIVFCSTNVMCNPASKPAEHMNPDSAVYASFESASLHPASIKIETLDPTMPVTCPQDDANYVHHHQERDDDEHFMQVKPEPMEPSLHNSVSLEQAEDQQQQEEEEHTHHRRVIKEEEDQEMVESLHQSPQQHQQQEEDLADTVPVGMSPTYHSSPANHSSPAHHSPSVYHSPPAHHSPLGPAEGSPAPAEASPAYQAHEEAAPAHSSPSISQQIESLNAIPASMDLDMDVDAFLGGAFENLQSQKMKDKQKKMQEEEEAEKQRQQEEKRAQENRRQEEERQKLLQEQIAQERAQYEAQLQARVDYSAGRGRGHMNQDAVMEEQDADDDTHDPEEEPLQEDENHNDQEASEQEQPPSAPTDQQQQQEEAPLDYRNDPTVIDVVEPNPDHGQFSRIIYRNLEVNPRPLPPANGIVNYKKFKKVKQFENYSSFDQSQVSSAPNAASSSSQNTNNRRRARDIFHDTDLGTLVPEDPDIAIRVNRPRFR